MPVDCIAVLRISTGEHHAVLPEDQSRSASLRPRAARPPHYLQWYAVPMQRLLHRQFRRSCLIRKFFGTGLQTAGFQLAASRCAAALCCSVTRVVTHACSGASMR
jgi:hypothetical protein